jgi:hypothetical protein
MTVVPPPTGAQQPLSVRQIQVLGWVLNRDVTRDSTFVYRALRRTTDVDDIVYQLEDLNLVDLLPNGLVVATPAGEQQWQQSRPGRRSPRRITPQFTPVAGHQQA